MTRVWAYTDGLRLVACFAEHAGNPMQVRKIKAVSTMTMFDESPPPWCDCVCKCHRHLHNFEQRCGRPADWELQPPVGDNLSGSIWSCDQCVFQCE